MNSKDYLPGACNIGPAETRRRLRGAWISVAGTVFLSLALYVVDASPVWQLTTWLPASLAAISFIQARSHFCAYFGFRGIYNFDELGESQKVILEEALLADRTRSLKMAAQSAAIGASVALAAFAIATLL